jgi:SAM-dependent methyltransferase
VTGARLIGIDVDEPALAAARHRAGQAQMTSRASFRTGSFSDTGLPDACVQAVMSIDALLFAPSKPAAAAEFARILVPGGQLVLTSWDYHSQPAGRPAQVADHRSLLDQAGFDVIGYEETRAWRGRRQRTGAALLAAADELAAESGGQAAQTRARIAEMNATLASVIRRVLVIAQRRPRNPGPTI